MRRCGMKVNVKLDINDTERDMLADYIDGETSKRLATRKDVNSFIQGCIDAAYELNDAPENEAEKLRAAGRSDGYIRGWLQVKQACQKK